MNTTIFDSIAQNDRNERGFAGEYFARQLLRKSGYIAERIAVKKSGDVRAVHPGTGEMWNVEVKTARRRNDGKFCYQLLTDKQDYRHSDYVLLLAVCGNGIVVTFLIPVDVLERRGAKTITLPPNLNTSAWSHYRVKSNTVRLGNEDQADS